jgi:Fe-S cluster biogenesis protein NfuA
MTADMDDIRQRLRRVLVEEIAPTLHLDGDAIEVLEVRDGVARLRLGGVCAGCPATTMSVIMGAEQELHRLLPEIDYIEAVP